MSFNTNTASNGLTKIDSVVKLGGRLNVETIIDGADQRLILKSGKSNLITLVSNSGFDGVVRDIKKQIDGKLIVVGQFDSYSGVSSSRIIRLNPDFTIDESFVVGSGFDTDVYSCAIQCDGKIVVVGEFNVYNGVGGIGRIARLNADGTLDNTFFINSGSGFNSEVFDVTILDNGKIILGGGFTEYNGDGSVSGVARLQSDGTLDTSFSTSGINGNTMAVVAPDGKIYFNDLGAFLERLNSDGSPDGSFSTYGIKHNTVAIQDDGKILVQGLRLNDDGTLDTSFNTGGEGFNSTVYDIFIQADGKSVYVGDFTTFNGGNVINTTFASRLDADGNLDSGFINQYANNYASVLYTVEPIDDAYYFLGGTVSNPTNNIFVYDYSGTSVGEYISNVSSSLSFSGGTIGLGGVVNYDNNYSSLFTDRSLVDRGYVISAINGSSGGTVTTNNGLTKVGSNIRLGGTFTGHTVINTTDYALVISGSNQFLSDRRVSLKVGFDNDLGESMVRTFAENTNLNALSYIDQLGQSISIGGTQNGISNMNTNFYSDAIVSVYTDLVTTDETRALFNPTGFTLSSTNVNFRLRLPNTNIIAPPSEIYQLVIDEGGYVSSRPKLNGVNGLSIQTDNLVFGGTLTGTTIIEGTTGLTEGLQLGNLYADGGSKALAYLNIDVDQVPGGFGQHSNVSISVQPTGIGVFMLTENIGGSVNPYYQLSGSYLDVSLQDLGTLNQAKFYLNANGGGFSLAGQNSISETGGSIESTGFGGQLNITNFNGTAIQIGSLDSGHAYPIRLLTASGTGANIELNAGDRIQMEAGEIFIAPTGTLHLNLPDSSTGDTYYRDSVGILRRLPIGSVGQVYSVSVSGTPVWQTTSGGTVTANNGLTKFGNNIRLGGMLTGHTAIDGGYNIIIGQLSPLSGFTVGVTNDILLYTSNKQVSLETNSSNKVIVHDTGITITTNSGGIYVHGNDFATINSTGDISLTTLNKINLIADSDEINIKTINSGDITLLAGNSNINLRADNGITISGNTSFNFPGAQYSEDYSSFYTGRSIPDVSYLTGKTSESKLERILLVVSNTTLTGSIDLALVATTGGTYTLTLPATPTNGHKITIKDDSGNAGTNNITVNGNGKNIDGLSTFLITSNYGGATFTYSSLRNKWYVTAFVN